MFIRKYDKNSLLILTILIKNEDDLIFKTILN